MSSWKPTTPHEIELVEALKYIAKQWPDSFAARHARATLASMAKLPAGGLTDG